MKRKPAPRQSPNGKARLSDFRPQRKNLNLGKPHGMAGLHTSIRRNGYGSPMVAVADGEVIDGSKRREAVEEIFPDVTPIVVHSDGTRPVIHVRDDIPNADDPRAVELAYAANVVAAMNWNPDGELLAAVAADNAYIADLARQENASLKAMLEGLSGQGKDDPNSEWLGMPEFESEDKTAYRSLIVHFETQEAVNDFQKLLGQKLTDKTKWIWHPKKEYESYGVVDVKS